MQKGGAVVRQTLYRHISWQTAGDMTSEELTFWQGERSLTDSTFVSMELSEPRPDLVREQSCPCCALSSSGPGADNQQDFLRVVKVFMSLAPRYSSDVFLWEWRGKSRP